MKKPTLLNVVLILSLLLGLTLLAGPVAAQEPVHWGYEGEEGPDHWGELSPDFALCADGQEQSPVNIPATAPLNPSGLTVNYQPSQLTILNNGHTIQANYDEGSSIQVDDIQYNLLQFHFHGASEHTIGGSHYPMEMHLVHQSADGGLAVVGVMIEEGSENSAFAPVWDHLPAEETEAEMMSGVTVDASQLLPADQSYYRYNGSLTTPPCSEGVKWFVMSHPVELSSAQISAFEAIMHDNYRPVQPLNARSFIAVPAMMPETGGVPFPLEGVLAGLGSLMAGAGLYLRRRQAA